jgi:hypothetical protein
VSFGLTVNVFRSSYNSSLNVFENAHKLTIVNVDGPFEATPEAPAAMLVRGNLRGTVKVVPAVQMPSGEYIPEQGHTMFCGAYVATSDSRWGEAVEKITGSRFYGAVALHDRVET